MSTPKRKDIAVIGGGAKAAAIAAKAAALRQAGLGNEVYVTVFEKKEVGSHWTGTGGYTDGVQRLCTPAARDVGYPYAHAVTHVNTFMHAQYSWQSFLLAHPHDYRHWVDHGTNPPEHADFARYLDWVVRRASPTLVLEEVTKLRPHAGKWLVESKKSGARKATHPVAFDGVVVTGPGPARRVPMTGKSMRRFDGEDFWLRLKDVRKAVGPKRTSDQIAIVGAGGTAAAVLAWLTRNGYRDHEIVMVASQAALFTRGDSAFENRLFSHEEAWESLSKESREQFFNRLNRGVVWGTVMDEVSSASRIVFVDGRAESIAANSRGDLKVIVRKGNGDSFDLDPAMLVDASGFDNWWFLDLIDGFRASNRTNKAFLDKLRDDMLPNLSFKTAKHFAPLHAPVHSSAIGPGYGSLMSLGAMSDRIVQRYALLL